MHCPRNIYWSCLSKVCFYFRKNLLFQDELTPSLSPTYFFPMLPSSPYRKTVFIQNEKASPLAAQTLISKGFLRAFFSY